MTKSYQIKPILLLSFLLIMASLVGNAQAKYQNVDVATFAKLSTEQEGQILDVRTMQEIQKGHIANAIFMDFLEADFKQQISKLDKNKPVYVYCWTGGRSAEAADLLTKQGFQNVYNLQGGIRAWQQQNKPVVPYENR